MPVPRDVMLFSPVWFYGRADHDIFAGGIS